MNDKKDLRRLFREQFPAASPEEVQKKLEAEKRRLQHLHAEAAELRATLEALKKHRLEMLPWPGAFEPLVLAAAFLTRGGDIDSIAEKVTELGSRPYALPAIRSTVYRLVRRGLLSESARRFTVTPQGERELAQARNDAKRWIDALGKL